MLTQCTEIVWVFFTEYPGFSSLKQPIPCHLNNNGMWPYFVILQLNLKALLYSYKLLSQAFFVGLSLPLTYQQLCTVITKKCWLGIFTLETLANVGGSNTSARNCGPPHQRGGWFWKLFKRGIKYFREIQKFQAKVAWGPLFRGSKYITTAHTYTEQENCPYAYGMSCTGHPIRVWDKYACLKAYALHFTWSSSRMPGDGILLLLFPRHICNKLPKMEFFSIIHSFWLYGVIRSIDAWNNLPEYLLCW